MDDDDAPPPGFGPNRFEQMMNYGSGRIQPVTEQRPFEQHSTAQYSASQYGAPQQQQPASSWQAQPPYQSNAQRAGKGYPGAQSRMGPPGPATTSVGAMRQFQRALTSSLGERQESAAAGSGRGRTAAQSNPLPSPDYGCYNQDDEEYGASNNRHGRQGPSKHPIRNSGSCNNLTSSHGNSYGNLSVSSTHSNRSQTSPVPRHTIQHQSAGDASKKALQQSPPAQHKQLCRTPTPDYGEYEHADEYGSRSSNKSGNRRRTPSSTAADPAAAAASQTLAGIHTPSGKKRRPVRRGGRRFAGQAAGAEGQVKLSAERTAQLEAELAALRSALAEAEAREMEAQMAVVHLATDNTTLQAQLEGMRTQKQQLETMLLFGGAGSETSQAGDEYDPYLLEDGDGSYSDECEDEEAAAEQQPPEAASQRARQSWADEMDEQEGTGVQQQQQTACSWALPGQGMAPGTADVLEAEEELRRLGLLPDSQSDATAIAAAAAAQSPGMEAQEALRKPGLLPDSRSDATSAAAAAAAAPEVTAEAADAESA